MADSKHIPGPWEYSFEDVDPEWAIVTIKGGLIVANVNAHHRQDANARLIAAAPDLLEALKALADECDRIGAALGAKGIGATVLGMRVAAARKAIAKAEGRS